MENSNGNALWIVMCIEYDNLLVLILDTNPIVWGKRLLKSEGGATFATVLEHILVFINAYLMLQHQNHLAIIASNVGERWEDKLHMCSQFFSWLFIVFSKFLFPRSADKKQVTNDGSPFGDFVEVKDHILNELRNMVASIPDSSDNTMFSGALSLGLCCILYSICNLHEIYQQNS